VTTLFQPPRLEPFNREQLQSFEENGYLLLRKGCSDDLIDAFNDSFLRPHSGMGAST
jgi:phytanoyl-CoA hydroxylase